MPPKRISAASKHILAVQSFLQGLGKLVGAGSGLASAANALETADDVFNLHALDKTGNALEVSVAAAHDLKAGDTAVFDLDLHQLRATPFGRYVNFIAFLLLWYE